MAVQRPLLEGRVEFIAPWGWTDELQSWSWPGAEGKPMAVRVYTSGDRVDLLLGGKPVASKKLTPADKMHAELTVDYAPGTLEAVAYKGDQIIARRKLETTGAAAKLQLVAEMPTGKSDRQALHYIRAEVLDAKGRVLPDDQRQISLAIDGPADLAAFGSANPLAVGSLQKPDAQSFRGAALAILRAQGRSGAVRIAAHSPGLASAATMLKLI